mmetsp:Transcript_116911/g.291755  ORF Transcript_116911/g.291755 Transcript_116911/m.291755 type:complete len:248 (+) Transcript_116911:1517-2260(+)
MGGTRSEKERGSENGSGRRTGKRNGTGTVRGRKTDVTTEIGNEEMIAIVTVNVSGSVTARTTETERGSGRGIARGKRMTAAARGTAQTGAAPHKRSAHHLPVDLHRGGTGSATGSVMTDNAEAPPAQCRGSAQRRSGVLHPGVATVQPQRSVPGRARGRHRESLAHPPGSGQGRQSGRPRGSARARGGVHGRGMTTGSKRTTAGVLGSARSARPRGGGGHRDGGRRRATTTTAAATGKGPPQGSRPS